MEAMTLKMDTSLPSVAPPLTDQSLAEGSSVAPTSSARPSARGMFATHPSVAKTVESRASRVSSVIAHKVLPPVAAAAATPVDCALQVWSNVSLQVEVS